MMTSERKAAKRSGTGKRERKLPRRFHRSGRLDRSLDLRREGRRPDGNRLRRRMEQEGAVVNGIDS